MRVAEVRHRRCRFGTRHKSKMAEKAEEVVVGVEEATVEGGRAVATVEAAEAEEGMMALAVMEEGALAAWPARMDY